MRDGIIVVLLNAWGLTITLTDVDGFLKIIAVGLTISYTFVKTRNELTIRKQLKKNKIHEQAD